MHYRNRTLEIYFIFMLFYLKKFIAQFLMPMPLVCEIYLFGWVLYHFTTYKKIGRLCTFIALFWFILFGYGFGRTYLYNLERRYPPFSPTAEQCKTLRGADIVVLGQGMPEKSDLPIRYQNNPVFERRLFEGIRVAKLIPDSWLIVSMAGAASNHVKQAFLNEFMAQVNFPINRVALFTTARDTSDEVSHVKKVIGNQKDFGYVNTKTNYLILITSAAHLPRAMKIFQKQGLTPIASPCDYRVREYPRFNVKWPYVPLPSGAGIETSECAFYEWLGNVYERIK